MSILPSPHPSSALTVHVGCAKQAANEHPRFAGLGMPEIEVRMVVSLTGHTNSRG